MKVVHIVKHLNHPNFTHYFYNDRILHEIEPVNDENNTN